MLLLDRLFLASNGLPLSFTSAGVRTGPLSAHGQPHLVAQPSVAADVNKALDIHLDFAAELPFDFVVLDNGANPGDFLVGPFHNLLHRVHCCPFEDLQCPCPSDAIDVGQRDEAALVLREVNAGDACHWCPVLLLALTLLEARIFLVDDVDASFPTHDLVIRMTLLDRGLHLHWRLGGCVTCTDR